MSRIIYKPEYANSWSLIIGINKYQYCNPLEYARDDAEAITQLMTDKFNFPKENIISLFDEMATKSAIMSSYMRFANDDIKSDDKLLVFFAGHGYTRSGIRSDIGYLMPVDGNIDDLSSLIRWDDLTKNSELINAKHIFYIMDACFSGLAITRALQPGSMRFLRDMLQRYSRQVLTAGKADEFVADSGGPVPKHSIFTGHLIEALEGKARSNDGIITANGIMSYVYEKVSKDIYSKQTPHFGFFDGDGDFIFDAPILRTLEYNGTIDEDILVEIPLIDDNIENNSIILDKVEQYISDESGRIKLDSLVIKEVKKTLSLTSKEQFPLQIPSVTIDTAVRRMKQYEDAINNLYEIVIPLAHWGNSTHLPIMQKIITRMTDSITMEGGNTLLLALRWYPLLMLIYAGGIAAIAGDNYKQLSTLFTSKIESNGKYKEIIIPIVQARNEYIDVFKSISGYERYYTPQSEYILKYFQPLFDDTLFLGKSYERLFDRFESFFALVYAHLTVDNYHFWGPPGRFIWKYKRYKETSAMKEIMDEANIKKDDWPPLRSGLFEGSYDVFYDIANRYIKLINGFNWD